LLFVAFENEDLPHFQTTDMGILVYAKRCQDLDEQIFAMLSLEAMGYYSVEVK